MLLAHAGRPGPNDVVLPKYTDEQKFINFEGKRRWLQLSGSLEFQNYSAIKITFMYWKKSAKISEGCEKILIIKL